MAVQFSVPHSRTSEYRLLPEHITIKPALKGDQKQNVADSWARGRANNGNYIHESLTLSEQSD